MNIEELKNRRSRREGTRLGKSRKQEDRVASAVRGRRTLASGALAFDKGDVVSGNRRWRIECKRTDKDRITIKREWLVKIMKESRGRIPALNIQIGDVEFYLVRPDEFSYIYDKA